MILCTEERHPLLPFLPDGATLLMLGSFPPQQKRWSMDFYYPNWNNDMWRIMGLLFFNDKEHFVQSGRKAFCKERLVSFLTEHGIALYDTATVVCRLKDNASDKFLEVLEPTDVAALLRRLPFCRAVVTTGEKATETFCTQLGIEHTPRVGDFTEFLFEGRALRLYRMPSSSRAYPLSIEKKSGFYRLMYQEIGILS
ncbi:MAG: uracil-DNA glycosylase family protein [Bacteroides sp.]|nr:uracil-DNA glycosylase family protein [Bacteroides sp.]